MPSSSVGKVFGHQWLPRWLKVWRSRVQIQEGKAVQSAAEVTNRFTALQVAQNEVTPDDLWKGTKTVLLEVAREMMGSVK